MGLSIRDSHHMPHTFSRQHEVPTPREAPWGGELQAEGLVQHEGHAEVGVRLRVAVHEPQAGVGGPEADHHVTRGYKV